MIIKTTFICLFCVLMTFIGMAQSDTIKRTFDDIDRILKSSKSHPAYFGPEEFGENLADSTTAQVLHRLATSKDKIELRKVAQVLGDRAMEGTLKLTDKETYIIEDKIRSYIRASGNFYEPNFSEIHNQILRFGDLAIYDLLSNLENSNELISAFAFDMLIQMRSERVVRIMINKAKACKNIQIKPMYINALGFMKQQVSISVPNRQCMNEKDSEELFTRLIQPALTELSPPTEQVSKD